MTFRGRISLPFLLGTATVFGVSSSVQSYWLSRVAEGKPPEMLLHVFILNIVYWYVPALLAPLIMSVATRYQLGRGRWHVAVIVHLAGAFAYSVVHTAAMFWTRMALMSAAPPRGWWFVARIEYLRQLDWLFMTYLFLVGLAHALAYRRESERRALTSAQLEMRLVEAQLQALQRQLHPHFLFNTLNAIAGLMRSDVEAADRMMDRLGDLLRMTLHTSNIQEVPLKEELELLQKYLDRQEQHDEDSHAGGGRRADCARASRVATARRKRHRAGRRVRNGSAGVDGDPVHEPGPAVSRHPDARDRRSRSGPDHPDAWRACGGIRHGV